MEKQLFDPTYINLDYLFYQVLVFGRRILNPDGDLSFVITGIKNFLALLAVILYCLIRLYEIKTEEKKKREALLKTPDPEPVSVSTKKYTIRWLGVTEHASSDKEGDWRLAIMEADSMLEEATIEKGWAGETLGERLKGVSENQFRSKQLAWEAHLVRNNIAHQGTAYELTAGETRKTIDKFNKVLVDLEVL
jgi:hypothetical protein